MVYKTASPLNSVLKSSIPGVARKVLLVAGIYYRARWTMRYDHLVKNLLTATELLVASWMWNIHCLICTILKFPRLYLFCIYILCLPNLIVVIILDRATSLCNYSDMLPSLNKIKCIIFTTIINHTFRSTDKIIHNHAKSSHVQHKRKSSNNSEKRSLLANKHLWTFPLHSSYASSRMYSHSLGGDHLSLVFTLEKNCILARLKVHLQFRSHLIH